LVTDRRLRGVEPFRRTGQGALLDQDDQQPQQSTIEIEMVDSRRRSWTGGSNANLLGLCVEPGKPKAAIRTALGSQPLACLEHVA
jgi:hypothetical protein